MFIRGFFFLFLKYFTTVELAFLESDVFLENVEKIFFFQQKSTSQIALYWLTAVMYSPCVTPQSTQIPLRPNSIFAVRAALLAKLGVQLLGFHNFFILHDFVADIFIKSIKFRSK
jgi:hypothetical protein